MAERLHTAENWAARLEDVAGGGCKDPGHAPCSLFPTRSTPLTRSVPAQPLLWPTVPPMGPLVVRPNSPCTWQPVLWQAHGWDWDTITLFPLNLKWMNIFMFQEEKIITVRTVTARQQSRGDSVPLSFSVAFLGLQVTFKWEGRRWHFPPENDFQVQVWSWRQ